MASQKPLFESVKPIRVTVPVSPETKAAFELLAAAQGCSLGKVMGEWLRDTAQAAQYMTEVLRDVKTRPFEVALKLNGYAAAASDMSSALVEKLRVDSKLAELGAGDRRGDKPGVSPAPVSARKSAKKGLTPPVGNTGGKVSGARTPKGSK